MEIIKSYFFDTYALYEIIHGNKNYEKYEKEISILTTKLNLMELHYLLLRLYGEERANLTYDRLLIYIKEISDEIIKEANKFRLLFKRRKLSYIDCVGYILAKYNGVKFLTGDKQFEDLENVEFVK